MSDNQKSASPCPCSFFGLPAVFAGIVLVLDQLSKLLVLRNWQEPGQIYLEVIPGYFSLVHFRNLGAAWGMFSGYTILLGVVSLLAFSAVIFFFQKLTEGKRPLAFSYGFLAGGIAGNLYDRFFRGFVVDFLFFYWKDYDHSWPAFNIADTAITCSVAFMIFYHLFVGEKQSAVTEKEK